MHSWMSASTRLWRAMMPAVSKPSWSSTGPVGCLDCLPLVPLPSASPLPPQAQTPSAAPRAAMVRSVARRMLVSVVDIVQVPARSASTGSSDAARSEG